MFTWIGLKPACQEADQGDQVSKHFWGQKHEMSHLFQLFDVLFGPKRSSLNSRTLKVPPPFIMDTLAIIFLQTSLQSCLVDIFRVR